MTQEEKNNLDIRKAVFPQLKIEKQNYYLILGMLNELEKKGISKEDTKEIREHLVYFITDCTNRQK